MACLGENSARRLAIATTHQDPRQLPRRQQLVQARALLARHLDRLLEIAPGRLAIALTIRDQPPEPQQHGNGKTLLALRGKRQSAIDGLARFIDGTCRQQTIGECCMPCWNVQLGAGRLPGVKPAAHAFDARRSAGDAAESRAHSAGASSKYWVFAAM